MKTFSLIFLLVAVASAGLVPPLGSVQEGIKSAQHEVQRNPALRVGVDPEDVAVKEEELVYDDGDPADGGSTDSSSSTDSNGSTDDSTTDDSLITDESTTDEGVSTDMTTDDGHTEPPTQGSTSSPPSQGLSGGEIAGIVIGTLAGVALIAGGIYFLKVKGYLCF